MLHAELWNSQHLSQASLALSKEQEAMLRYKLLISMMTIRFGQLVAPRVSQSKAGGLLVCRKGRSEPVKSMSLQAHLTGNCSSELQLCQMELSVFCPRPHAMPMDIIMHCLSFMVVRKSINKYLHL